MFVSHYIRISKQPFRNLSATHTTGLGLSRKGFLFSSLKKGHWICSFSLSPLESYDKSGRAPGESKYSQQTLKEGHWKFPTGGNGLSE